MKRFVQTREAMEDYEAYMANTIGGVDMPIGGNK